MLMWYKYDGEFISSRAIIVEPDWIEDSTGITYSHKNELAEQGGGFFSNVVIETSITWPYGGGQRYRYISGAAIDANIAECSINIPAVRLYIKSLVAESASNYMKLKVNSLTVASIVFGTASEEVVTAARNKFTTLQTAVAAVVADIDAAETLEALAALIDPTWPVL